jgi:hypothetical protein
MANTTFCMADTTFSSPLPFVGEHLADTKGAASGVGKQYRHAGSDLSSRFADQFSVWKSCGISGPAVGRAVQGTIIRLALRSESQAGKVPLHQVGLAMQYVNCQHAGLFCSYISLIGMHMP